MTKRAIENLSGPKGHRVVYVLQGCMVYDHVMHPKGFVQPTGCAM